MNMGSGRLLAWGALWWAARARARAARISGLLSRASWMSGSSLSSWARAAGWKKRAAAKQPQETNEAMPPRMPHTRTPALSMARPPVKVSLESHEDRKTAGNRPSPLPYLASTLNLAEAVFPPLVTLTSMFQGPAMERFMRA